jgi:hypothetical protein
MITRLIVSVGELKFRSRPRLQLSSPEIGSELHEVDVVEPINRFQFQNDLPGDHEVNAGLANRYTLEGDIDWKLRLKRYGSVRE